MIWLLLGASCTKDDTGESGVEEPWHLALTGEGDAMLLSAWEHGGELLMVGGGLGDDAHGDLFRYSGGALCVEHEVTEEALWWIHGDGSEWLAVGEKGTVLRSDNSRDDIDTDYTLYGAWMDGADTTWVVGGDISTGAGAIWSHAGADWDLRQETEGVMFKAWEGIFIGDKQTWILDQDVFVEVETDHRLVTLRDTTAVGGAVSSLIVEWDGSDWVEQDTLFLNGPLNGLYEHEGTLHVGGNAGTMGYRGDSGWVIPDFPLTSDTFHAVWAFEDTVFFLGGNFFSAGDNHATVATYGDVESIAFSECP